MDQNPQNIPIRAMRSWLFEPIDVAPLALFRIAFGLILFLETVMHWRLIDRFWVDPAINFSFDYLSFIKPWPGPGMKIHFAVMAVAAMGICVGAFYRASALTFAVLYTYLLLIDQAYFNNHFYLAAVIAWWLAAAPAHHRLSVDRLLARGAMPQTCHRWHLWILIAQLSIVYGFGSIAKLNHDWLHGEPMRQFLRMQDRLPLSREFLLSEPVVLFFVWGGIIFDLLVVPALLWRRTRAIAVVASLFFHLTNSQVFQIGIFPWLAMCALVLFMPPDTVGRWVDRMTQRLDGRLSTQSPAEGEPASAPAPGRQRVMLAGLALYLLVQLLVPLRHHLYPGNWSWTEEGVLLAWNMKLNAKDTFVGIRVIDPDRGLALEVDQSKHMAATQMLRMWQKPRLIARYAKFLDAQARAANIANPVIEVRAVASLNGRPYQFLTDPSVDLVSVDDSPFHAAEWIVPLNADQPIGVYPTEYDKFQQVMAVIVAYERDRPR